VVAARLRQEEFPAHAAVLAFEDIWGGLVVPAVPDRSQPRLSVGAYYCLAEGLCERGGHANLELVPIAWSPDDFVYFLNADGTVWGQHLIAMDRAAPVNDDGDTFIASQVLWDVLWARSPKTRSGFVGEALAARLRLDALPGMQTKSERWWGCDDTLVVEAQIFGEEEAGRPSTLVGTTREEAVRVMESEG